MYYSLIIKTAVLYFYIIFCYRLMGKKEVGKLSIIDLIVSVLIAELAAMSIEEVDSSILVSIIPILVLVIIQISLRITYTISTITWSISCSIIYTYCIIIY